MSCEDTVDLELQAVPKDEGKMYIGLDALESGTLFPELRIVRHCLP